jgi:hypothetical protein
VRRLGSNRAVSRSMLHEFPKKSLLDLIDVTATENRNSPGSFSLCG